VGSRRSLPLGRQRRRAVTPLRRGWRSDAFVAAAALVPIVLWELSGWDLALARWYGDAAGFALRETWLARTVLHDGGRALAAIVLLLLVADVALAIVSGPTRRERGYWLLVVITCMVVVPLFKRFSSTSCPWDLAQFGGAAPYVPHWWLVVIDGGPGHCFPSGHAAAAFAFFGSYMLWREHRPGLARGILVAVLGLGVLFAWAQMVRGAHFASHAMWTAWFCWTVAVVAKYFAPAAGMPAGAQVPAGEEVTRPWRPCAGGDARPRRPCPGPRP